MLIESDVIHADHTWNCGMH